MLSSGPSVKNIPFFIPLLAQTLVAKLLQGLRAPLVFVLHIKGIEIKPPTWIEHLKRGLDDTAPRFPVRQVAIGIQQGDGVI